MEHILEWFPFFSVGLSKNDDWKEIPYRTQMCAGTAQIMKILKFQDFQFLRHSTKLVGRILFSAVLGSPRGPMDPHGTDFRTVFYFLR